MGESLKMRKVRTGFGRERKKKGGKKGGMQKTVVGIERGDSEERGNET